MAQTINDNYSIAARQVAEELVGLQTFFRKAPAERRAVLADYHEQLGQLLRSNPGFGVEVDLGFNGVLEKTGQFLDIPKHIAAQGWSAATDILAGDHLSHIFVRITPAEAERIGARTAELLKAFDENRAIPDKAFSLWDQLVANVTAFFVWIQSDKGTSFDDVYAEIIKDTQVQSAAERVRDQAKHVRDGLIAAGTSPEIAQLISGLDANNKFIATPSFVNKSDKELVSAVTALREKENPDLGGMLQQASQGETRDVVGGAVAATAVSAVALKVVATPVVMTSSLIRGMAEGTAAKTRQIGNVFGIGRAPSTSPHILSLLHDSPNMANSSFQTAARTSEVSGSRAVGRALGRKIPLIGIGYGLISLPALYNSLLGAESSGEITPDEAAALRSLMAVDTVALLGGFLTDGASEASRHLIRVSDDPSRHAELVEKFLPETLSGLVLGTSATADISENQRVVAFMDRLDVPRERSGFRPATNGMVELNRENVAALVDRWQRYDHEGGANPLADHPVMKALQQEYADAKTAGRTHGALSEYVNSPAFEQIGLWQISSSLHGIEGVSVQQFVSDMAHQGPLYYRLLESSLASGQSLATFENNLLRTLRAMANDYPADIIRDQRASAVASATLAMIEPELFGLSSPTIASVTEQEATLYHQLHREGRSGGIFQSAVEPGVITKINDRVQADQARLQQEANEFNQRYFEEKLLYDDSATISAGQLHQVIRHPQFSGTLFGQWLNEHGHLAMLRTEIAGLMHAPEASLSFAARDIVNEYMAFVKSDGWSRYQDQRDAALAELERLDKESHGILALAMQAPEGIDHAVSLAYALANDSVANPSISGLTAQAAKVKQASEQMMSAGQSAANEAFYRELSQFMRLMAGSRQEIAQLGVNKDAVFGQVPNDAETAQMLAILTAGGVVMPEGVARAPRALPEGATAANAMAFVKPTVSASLVVAEADGEFRPVETASKTSYSVTQIG